MKIVLIFILLLWVIQPTFGQNAIDKKSLTLENIKSLMVEGSFSNIYITGQGNKVVFDGIITGSGKKGKYTIEHEIINGKLKVWIDRQGSNWGYNNLRSKLNFKIPENIDIVIDNSSGNIELENLSGNNIEVDASSGNITANNINNDISVEASSGNIKLYGAKGNISANASSGNLSLNDITGNINAKTSSGNITIRNSKGNISATNSSGDIKINDTTGSLELETTSGGIKGTGVKITGDSFLSSSSGNISMDVENNPKEYAYDLKTSSGNIKVGNLSAEDKFIKRTEGVLIAAKASSGNIIIY
ncbi:MAG TPA: DUF4097 domain-containing protein [Cyclobacteriaceae bacterium]